MLEIRIIPNALILSLCLFSLSDLCPASFFSYIMPFLIRSVYFFFSWFALHFWPPQRFILLPNGRKVGFVICRSNFILISRSSLYFSINLVKHGERASNFSLRLIQTTPKGTTIAHFLCLCLLLASISFFRFVSASSCFSALQSEYE